MPTTESLLCLGVSARWLAQSLHDTGHSLIATDLFADCDSAEYAEFHRVEAIEDFPDLVAKLSPSIAVMGGGLETHIDIVESVAQRTTLLNCSAQAIRRVRDPWELQSFANQASLRFPKTYRLGERPHKSESFVCKELNRSGGAHVRRDELNELTDRSYFQSWIEGVPMSASFLACTSGCKILGVFRQLIGESAFGCKKPFQFAGAIGPLDVCPTIQKQMDEFGALISKHFGLVGLFGVDFILDSQKLIWLIEVNPRPTSTMELLERLGSSSLLSAHLQAFRAPANSTCDIAVKSSLIAAKAILFWDRNAPFKVGSSLHEKLMDAWRVGDIADVPNIGTIVKSGQPIITIYGTGIDDTGALRSLYERAKSWYQVFAKSL
ncbi:MAG: ATP-grasp domain-containing protein [Pirellulaceae bacterium]